MEKTMSRATIMGCACVITSSLTCEQIEAFKKFHPEALEMKGEGSDEALFTIDINDGPGSFEGGKAVFSRTKTQDGKATITILLDPDIEDKQELVRKTIGPGLLLLKEMEQHLLEAVEPLKEEIQKLDGMISWL